MEIEEVYQWLMQGQRRQQIVISMGQPMTAMQIARHTHLSLDSTSYVIGELAMQALLKCLNHMARRSRVYWLTRIGKVCQRRLRAERRLQALRHDYPRVEWDLYGSILYAHRSAVIKALGEPLQPSVIKRRALASNHRLRMSANNVRDVIRFFRQKEIVRRIEHSQWPHPKYELTDTGKMMRDLLFRADLHR